MPKRSNIPCKHSGCARLISYGSQYCEEHALMHRQDAKGSKDKGYDNRWRVARAMFLKAHPLCAKCIENGRFEKAIVVDHIVPHRGDRTLFWDESNWQPLCKSCHDTKTMTEDRYQKYKY